jgi:hypothetical protein
VPCVLAVWRASHSTHQATKDTRLADFQCQRGEGGVVAGSIVAALRPDDHRGVDGVRERLLAQSIQGDLWE